MSNLYESTAPLHGFEVQLYQNHLQGGENTFVARNTKEKTLNIDEICGSMRVRGGYEGSIEDANKTIRHFLKEAMFLLCDGYSVNLDWYTISVHVSGLFHGVNEPFDPKKHKVGFSFHTLKAMREQASHITIKVNGHIEDAAYITEFRDMEEQHMHPNMYDQGHVCEIVGQRIKIDGPSAEAGLWMVPVLDPAQRVKVTRIISNAPSRIEFMPVNTNHADNRLEIRTRFSGAGNPLAQTRTITSNFIVSTV